ncbi:hypothetical protein DPMN_022372 [Dreissena polymorpha]|uniref:Galactosyltransferase N-terminal domain-containing protein n=1 Tax=Dreissena polymorpha TaxID=45954 RepID=A0A9D4SBN4_DREPO|nr:hypothetical protein DPMN_022372 [Dreissena polymorpha]
MNAAFAEVRKIEDFDCFVFHDVDMIPEDDRNIYTCTDAPKHMSPALDKFGYRYTVIIRMTAFDHSVYAFHNVILLSKLCTDTCIALYRLMPNK